MDQARRGFENEVASLELNIHECQRKISTGTNSECIARWCEKLEFHLACKARWWMLYERDKPFPWPWTKYFDYLREEESRYQNFRLGRKVELQRAVNPPRGNPNESSILSPDSM